MRLVVSLGRTAFTAGMVAFALATVACGGKSGTSDTSTTTETITVSGTITYSRVPLVRNAEGVPTGLETDSSKFQKLPARGLRIRFYKSVEETAPDGTKQKVWKLAANDTETDSSGKYTASIEKGVPAFVEIMSRTSGARVLADALDSSANQAERAQYLLRKSLDGSSSTTNPVNAAAATASATVDFDLGQSDKWWLGVSSPATVTQATLEAQGTGSRILGILDSVYAFYLAYGRYVPAIASGEVLDLHYRRGVSVPRGTFIEFDRSRYPQAFDSSTGTRHFFGAIRGAADNDDAWDEGVLYHLLGRGMQAMPSYTALLPIDAALTHLAPDLALAEGLALGMAANLQKNPYIADTTGSGVTILDIRDRSGLASEEISPYSAPNIAALTWAIALNANSVTAPGSPTTWTNINPNALLRWFVTTVPISETDATKAVDVRSVYGQVKRLRETKLATEPVDLAAIFSDAALTSLLAPYGLTWPRPTTGEHATFLLDWGSDPNSPSKPLPAIQLSMAKAAQVRGTYPNASEREVAYAQFFLTKDTAFNVQVATQPATLPAGVAVEIYFPGILRTLTFSGGEPPTRLVFAGNSTTPVTQTVRVRVLSPNQVAADILATVQLVPAP